MDYIDMKKNNASNKYGNTILQFSNYDIKFYILINDNTIAVVFICAAFAEGAAVLQLLFTWGTCSDYPFHYINNDKRSP